MKRGIFSVDPGGHTGLAWCVVDIQEGLGSREHTGSETITGKEQHQIVAICRKWMAFYRYCVQVLGLDPEDVELVCEDFKPIPGRGHTDEGISPVKIIWGITGYRMGTLHEYDRNEWGPAYMPEMVMQLAQLVTTYATNDRLKKWGLWVVGREHERSAWRHIAYRVSKLQSLHAGAGS